MKQLFKIVFLILSVSLFSQTDINKLDDNGKKIGLWKGVFENTKHPKYEGTFDHDKEVGLFKFFDNQLISYQKSFENVNNVKYLLCFVVCVCMCVCV